MDRGTWQATACGIAKSRIQPSDEAQHTALTENGPRNEEMRHSYQQPRVTVNAGRYRLMGSIEN